MDQLFSSPLSAHSSATVMGRIYNHFVGHQSSVEVRILLIVVMAILAHLAAKGIRRASEWLLAKSHGQTGRLEQVTENPKFDTITRLIVSSIAFVIYFFAIGLVLEEFGFGLTAYLTSTSVLGLAISFGSQGLIQDIVIGLTLIFWDAMDVNDMVEIVGPTTSVVGRVEEIGMRFTKIVNFFGQKVLIPNRTIGNISRFPHGGVDAYADPQIPIGSAPDQVAKIVETLAVAMWTQFGAIILAEPIVRKIGLSKGETDKFIRVHFKIWPGQGALIETTFRKEVVKALAVLDPTYSDWQVPVTYRAGTTSKIVRVAP